MIEITDIYLDEYFDFAYINLNGQTYTVIPDVR